MNKIAVFDLDGTLLDTLDDLRDSVNHALLAGGMPPRSREEVRSFVGNGIAKLIERSLPQGVSPETAAETLSLFKAHYAENCCNGTRPYDGVPELLRELKAQGFTLAVVSNKADSLSKKLMERFYPGIFTEVRGELPEVRKKPAPDPLLLCCQDIGAPVGETVYVGDMEIDLQTALSAGTRCVLVSWGFRSAKELEILNAPVAHTPAELGQILIKL